MLKRYKDQHIESYKQNFVNENFQEWSNFETSEREAVLRKLQEDGWLTWSFYITISKVEQNKYIEIVRSLLIFKKDYFDFPIELPNIIDAEKRQLQDQVRIALTYIFTLAEDFMFYDFITIYENTALSDNEQVLFIKDIDRYFGQLGVNMTFSSNEIIPRQSEEIQTKIVEPTLRLLESDSYLQINNELSEGFNAYKEKNFGEFILCTVNALISTLENVTYGEITQKQRGFDKMLAKLNSEKILSNKIQTLLKSINSYIEIERRDKTKAHISKIKATEEEALFIFNLVMSVIQYLILTTSKK